jgi:hypothetical protein
MLRQLEMVARPLFHSVRARRLKLELNGKEPFRTMFRQMWGSANVYREI